MAAITHRYIDQLFRDAEQRMGYFLVAHAAEQNRLLEAKLKEALEKIRPAPTVHAPVEDRNTNNKDNGWTELTVRRQDGRLRIRLR